jgi:hypothetical protein
MVLAADPRRQVVSTIALFSGIDRSGFNTEVNDE